MVRKNMVKSNICPVCFAYIEGEYIEEGDLRISDEAISCPNRVFTLEEVVDECPELEELEELDKGVKIRLTYTRSKYHEKRY